MCDTCLQGIRLSFCASSSQALLFSEGPCPCHSHGSCHGLICHLHRLAHVPQTDGSKGCGLKAPHHMIYWGWCLKPSAPLPGTSTWQHSRNCDHVYVSWYHSRLVDSLSWVVSGHLFLILVLNRGTAQMYQPVCPSLCTPPASSVCSMSHVLLPSFLCLQWARDTPTQKHTHIQATQAHTCTHTHVQGTGTQMQTGNTGISVAEGPVVHMQCKHFHTSYTKISSWFFTREI